MTMMNTEQSAPPRDGGPVLSARGIGKTFDTVDPPVQVLKGINLEVGPGEFVAVMGSSGSGKSTLLYCISGMDRPTEGAVRYLGRDLTELDDKEMGEVRLREMGFVFQQPYFLENLSIRDNILLPAVKAGHLKGQEAEAHVDGLLQRFGIDHVGDNGVTRVSGGQLQRAAICRALVNSPAVLFADEPTGALNSSMTEEVLEVLGQVHASGTSIVMVTHDPGCAVRADRIVYLSDGQVIDEYRMGPWAGGQDARGRLENARSWLERNNF